jgi:hypothetical protein
MMWRPEGDDEVHLREEAAMSAAIVMIHGRGPKPRKETLLDCWKEFLPPAARAAPLSMVHWVDLFGYDPPVLPDDEHDCAHIAGADLPDLSAQAFSAAAASREVVAVQEDLTGRAFSWQQIRDGVLEAFWRKFTAVSDNQFALDAQNFFADVPTLRTESRRRLKDAIMSARAQGHEVMVLAHSFGTIVAYELARELRNREIHTLVTLGGPLAWCYDMWGPAKPPPTQDYFNAKVFPHRGVRNWWNVFDPGDPVATAKVMAVLPQVAPAYRSGNSPVIIDCPIANTYTVEGEPGSPHDYRGYLSSAPVQRAIRLFLLEVAG